MDSQELTSRVRALRARGSTPKAIARALGVPPAIVAPLVRAIAAEDHASAPEREFIQCWVSPGWRQGLTVNGHQDWPGGTSHCRRLLSANARLHRAS